MKIWAYNNIVREIWMIGFTGRVVFFEGDSARGRNRPPQELWILCSGILFGFYSECLQRKKQISFLEHDVSEKYLDISRRIH
jgi:hypothetical protein